MKRGDAITKIYNDLLNLSKDIVENEDQINLFPTLDDIDMDDLVNFVKYKLVNHKDNYDDLINDLSNSQNININTDKYTENKNMIYKKLNTLIVLCTK